MKTTAQDHNWQAAGYPPEEAAEWLAAGVMTPTEAWEWRVGGYRATDPELVLRIECEWDLAGLAILYPEATRAEMDAPGAVADFVGPERRAIFAAARVVWARQRQCGCRDDVDRGRLVAELIRSYPGTDVVWWKWAIDAALRHTERFDEDG